MGPAGQAIECLPNGDVPKLGKAADEWSKFSKHTTVTGAAGQITTIIGLFDGVVDKKNLEPVLGHLTTLRDGASQVTLASQNLASPVSEFHTGTSEARSTFESEINILVVSAGIAVAAGIIAAAFSFGGSLAISGGAVGALVLNTINAIRTAYTASKFYRLLGLAAATATATVVLTHFDKVPTLTAIGMKLTEMIAMRVLVDDDADIPDLPGFRHGEYTQDEIEEFINGYGRRKSDHG
ncbi:hypothetical protein [Nocardia sp. NPDC057440]|uniref:hypothetical protein n=1 Tax=Nocardia sp. NPDC057440 TaxID=3346134 RepID=UPI0036706B7C